MWSRGAGLLQWKNVPHYGVEMSVSPFTCRTSYKMRPISTSLYKELYAKLKKNYLFDLWKKGTNTSNLKSAISGLKYRKRRRDTPHSWGHRHILRLLYNLPSHSVPRIHGTFGRLTVEKPHYNPLRRHSWKVAFVFKVKVHSPSKGSVGKSRRLLFI